MAAILDLIMVVLRIATFIIIIQAVLSWLVGFNVLSLQNPTVRSVWGGLQRITARSATSCRPWVGWT